jgi:hypothetical protein
VLKSSVIRKPRGRPPPGAAPSRSLSSPRRASSLSRCSSPSFRSASFCSGLIASGGPVGAPAAGFAVAALFNPTRVGVFSAQAGLRVWALLVWALVRGRAGSASSSLSRGARFAPHVRAFVQCHVAGALRPERKDRAKEPTEDPTEYRGKERRVRRRPGPSKPPGLPGGYARFVVLAGGT